MSQDSKDPSSLTKHTANTPSSSSSSNVTNNNDISYSTKITNKSHQKNKNNSKNQQQQNHNNKRQREESNIPNLKARKKAKQVIEIVPLFQDNHNHNTTTNGAGTVTFQRSQENNKSRQSKKDNNHTNTATNQVISSNTANYVTESSSSPSSSFVPPSLSLVRSIDVVQFAEARAHELNSLEKALRNATEHSGMQRVFQKLPRHMRRRAASHNVKRLPQKYRQKAIEQMARDPKTSSAASNDSTNQRKSRKSKRRAGSIAKHFAKRKSNRLWLETHVWHAKRMHMDQKWGYKIALHPNEKNFRSMYRASIHESVIYDASYMEWIEIVGNDYDAILFLLKRIVDPAVNIGHPMLIQGKRVGKTHFYGVDNFPKNLICPFEFIWKPPTKTDHSPDYGMKNEVSESRHENKSNDVNINQAVLWICVHPSCTSIVLQILMNAKELLPNTRIPNTTKLLFNTETVYDVDSTNDTIQLSTNTSKLASSSKRINHVEFKQLVSELVRFEFTGPRSHAILRQVLQLDPNDPNKDVWEALSNLQTSASLPPGCILNLNVEDPRLSPPPKMESREVQWNRFKENEEHGEQTGDMHLVEDGSIECRSDIIVDSRTMTKDNNNNTTKLNLMDTTTADSSSSSDKKNLNNLNNKVINQTKRFAKLQNVLLKWDDHVKMEINDHYSLWNAKARKDLMESKPSNKELEERKRQNLIPGTKLDFMKDKDVYVPVMLFQRNRQEIMISKNDVDKELINNQEQQVEDDNDCQMNENEDAANDKNKKSVVDAICRLSNSNFGLKSSREFKGGYTLILPKSWATAFWMKFIFAGCRAGGLREWQSMHYESGMACFPFDYVGTKAYETEMDLKRSELERTYLKKPKSKRGVKYGELANNGGFEEPFEAGVWRLTLSNAGKGETIGKSDLNEQSQSNSNLNANTFLVSPFLLRMMNPEWSESKYQNNVDQMRERWEKRYENVHLVMNEKVMRQWFNKMMNVKMDDKKVDTNQTQMIFKTYKEIKIDHYFVLVGMKGTKGQVIPESLPIYIRLEQKQHINQTELTTMGKDKFVVQDELIGYTTNSTRYAFGQGEGFAVGCIHWNHELFFDYFICGNHRRRHRTTELNDCRKKQTMVNKIFKIVVKDVTSPQKLEHVMKCMQFIFN